MSIGKTGLDANRFPESPNRAPDVAFGRQSNPKIASRLGSKRM
jgi:hypothetical protein